MFKQLYSIPVADGDELVHRECMLFVSGSRFLIVATYCTVTDYFPDEFYTMYRNNESMLCNQQANLEDSTVCLLDLKWGVVADKHRFHKDKIVHLHNQGLSLYENLLAVLSIQHQTIHMFSITDNGKLVHLLDIGRFCLPQDSEMFNEAGMTQDSTYVSVPSSSNARQANAEYYPFREKVYNSLKHRLLVHLFKEAKVREANGDKNGLNWYFSHFSYFKSLRLWRLQLIDRDHLLLKYAGEDVVAHKVNDQLSRPAFFVLYRFPDAQILNIFESSSPSFLTIAENFLDHLRAVAINPEPLAAFSPSLANNIYARANHDKTKRTIVYARYGGELEAVRRSLLILPLSSQCWSTSPYFDNNIFMYDEKWISPMERPKPCSDFTVRFHSRLTGRHVFSLNMVKSPPGVEQPHKPVAAYIFHPFEPFVISIQRKGLEFFVNFHFWLRYAS
jgi:de-etiolated-1